MKAKEIISRLQMLKEDSHAIFGKMTAQHMIEHLTLTIKISYGRIKIPHFEPSERQLKEKQYLLYTDLEFPVGVKAPGLPDELLPLRYANLNEAKEELIKSIEAFNELFEANPDLFFIHPRLGLLNQKEWRTFHEKHLTHHFKQFGI
ncbi:DUF1569 domain-containing protein [Algoriphagus mannitolivorans]|uniref:DUF1569 domain-containing protein n=1 Tax=Algoriphagus mannitolivorans TaxID=226504 RepID=UPI0004793D61|nr:DUF1569 domain-containing protein [Algoriphagus mannitolivorans]